MAAIRAAGGNQTKHAVCQRSVKRDVGRALLRLSRGVINNWCLIKRCKLYRLSRSTRGASCKGCKVYPAAAEITKSGFRPGKCEKTYGYLATAALNLSSSRPGVPMML